ncbi:MAG: TIR domain-containing protein [Chloroflexi bacterium]|nr:TIR domain-containing protein [Chloroflexota bacterium]
MPRIFISYRREDSRTITGRIYDRLVTAFGRENVFKDVDSVPPGKDFRGVIKEAVSNCDVVLVIIGPRWLHTADKQGNRRLDNPQDFVRVEVETGLQRQGVDVIPLLVEGASFPSEDELPTALKQLAFRNAWPVQDDPYFHRDMDRLIDHLRPMRYWKNVPCKWIVGAVVIPILAALIAGVLPAVLNQDTVTPTNAVILHTVTPSATSTLTPSISPTSTPTTTYSPTDSPTPTVTTSPTDTATNTPTKTSTPTDTASPTSAPIHTPESSLSNVEMITPTSLEVSAPRSYPCDATVIYNQTALLNVIRAGPSSKSSFRPPIRQGATIKILSKDQEATNEFWYHIADSEGNVLGWIPTDYVIPGEDCPV